MRGIDWDRVSDLGKKPDTELAEELDCSPHAVGRARRMRGIPRPISIRYKVPLRIAEELAELG